MKAKILNYIFILLLSFMIIVLLEQHADIAKLNDALAAVQHAYSVPSAAPGKTNHAEDRLAVGQALPGSKAITIKNIIRDANERDKKFHAAMAGDLRAARSRREVERLYGPYLSTLGLSSEQQSKIKNLLMDRMSTELDARDLGLQNHIQGQELENLVKGQLSLIDQQLQSTVDPPTFQQLQEMAALRPEIDQIESAYGLDMAFAEAPLAGAQAIDLAMILHATYDTSANPNAMALRSTLAPDGNGESVLDAEAIKRASEILTPTQLEILKNDLIVSTKGITVFHPGLQSK